MHAKTVGTTNLIVLDADGNSMLDVPLIVAEPPPETEERLTLHVVRGSYPLQKFHIYRCPSKGPGEESGPCEHVKEPEREVDQSTTSTDNLSYSGSVGGGAPATPGGQ